ncbi:HNH endonuclease family protein [Streptomyces sp. NPDC004610]|uniref:HNH endonuclease family protein n=1 Tax=unclassified Streptomyces TaxID=2593676 RepID=UPI0033B64CC6
MRLRGGAVSAAAALLLAVTGCTEGTTGGGGAEASRGAEGGGGAALAAARELTVKGRAPRTGYDRDRFGTPWADTDSNRCGTRDDILERDLTDVEFTDGRCEVASGTLAPDPYTGRDVEFERGRSEVDIDHLVALSDAWQKGAQQWEPGKRIAFANDPLNLLAVDAGTNRAKGDGDTATWLPPDKAYRCTYVAGQVAVKRKYGLWVTAAERDAMTRVLSGCPDEPLPTGGNPTAAPPRFTAD